MSVNKILNKFSDYAPVVLRVGLSLVFLWFGSEQIWKRCLVPGQIFKQN